MVYPDSPFTELLNESTIISLHNTNNKQEVCKDIFINTLKWLCISPSITSFRVNTLKSTVEDIKKLLDDSLIKITISSGKSHCKPNISIHPILPDVIIINSYDKKDLDLSKQGKEVIVDALCGAAVLRGAHVFAPGVMGMQSGTKLNDKVSVYADIKRKCKKGLQKTYDCPDKVFVGNGVVKMIRNQLFGEDIRPVGIAVEITDPVSGCPPLSENNVPTGSALLQNIPSIVCGYVLNPKPGDVVLDMCAAPGNKTSHLAALMENNGILIALDKTKRKYEQLKQKCVDFSINCVYPFEFDSTKLCDEKLCNFNVESHKEPPFPPETFDRILLDAPCSGLGNRPQLLNRITDKIAKSYIPLQRKLFTNAVSLLKIGGHLVYSTCSIALAENEGMVAWAVQNFPCLKLVPAEPALGGAGWHGSNLTETELKMVQRFGPNGANDSIGFFIAHFIKM